MPIFRKKRAGVRMYLVLFSLIILLSIFSSVALASMLGDVNEDGEIDVRDVVLIMKHVLEIEYLDDAQQELADVNQDGDVNINDVTMVMQYALGLINNFPGNAAEVVSVKAASKTVDSGTELNAIDFPEQVEVVLDDDSEIYVSVDWEEESAPQYDSEIPYDYVFEGKLVNLPQGVTNPKEVKAKLTVIVSDPNWVKKEVHSELDFDTARAQGVDRIVLKRNIMLTKLQRIDWDLKQLDLNGYEITLVGGRPLVFEKDGTRILNGKISGLVTADPPTGGANANWDDPNGWQRENVVLIEGDNVRFQWVIFNVNVADWFQKQDQHANGLQINEAAFFGLSLFVSDVNINDSIICNRIGVENNSAQLNRINLHQNRWFDEPWNEGDQDSIGILYIYGDVTMTNINWYDNYTGMYVGKSLKYHGDHETDGAYKEVHPTLEGASIATDKYGLVWWGINHYKAKLEVNGKVHSYSDGGGPGLMLVGTDVTDYDEKRGDTDIEAGGAIVGNAKFTGADVFFGKPTYDFLSDNPKILPGMWSADDENPKEPVCLDEVDCQACHKDADRLTIDGHTFLSDVYIFTPFNDYMECENGDEETVYLNDSVWLGNVTLTNAYLWGDFTILNGKTVTVKREIVVCCNNIRGIFTEGNLSSQTVECKDDFKDFLPFGTLTGGRIIGDTKEDNVLVLGDGLYVKNVDLHRFLYNVILESVKLDAVNIYVGDSNTNDDREVCGEALEYDIHIWPGHHATFSNVMWTQNTTVEVKDYAKLSLINKIGNYGPVKLQTYAFIDIDDNAVLVDDIRAGHSVDIEQKGGRAYVTVNFGTFGNWNFNGWKADVKITADDRMLSSKYEIDINGKKYIVDLRDPDRYDWDITEGVKLTEMLGMSPEEISDTFNLADWAGEELTIRISSEEDNKSFKLNVEAWAVNCCSQQLISLGGASKEVTLDGKDIQIGWFKCRIMLDPEDDFTAGDTVNVTWNVTNIGAKTDDQTVKAYWFFNGVRQDDSEWQIDLIPEEAWNHEWTLDTGILGAGEYMFRLETEDTTCIKTIRVKTDELNYSLAMTVNPANSGTATDETDEGPYEAGTEVDIKASGNQGYEFEEWTADAGSFANATEAETTFTMPAQNVTVTANFITGKLANVSAADLVYSAADFVYETEWSFVITEVKLDQGKTVTIDLSEALNGGLKYSTDNTDYDVAGFTVDASNAQVDGAERIVLTSTSDIVPGAEVKIDVSGITLEVAVVEEEFELTITRDDTGESGSDFFNITD